jgi:hypothetical protein
MRKLILASIGAMILIGGIWTAAFTIVGPSDAPAIIGPAVVVGSTGTPGGQTGTPGATPAKDDHGTRTVPASPAVRVSDDHGGRGGSGKHGQ